MKKNEVKVGGLYKALVNGKLVTVRVDRVVEYDGFRSANRRVPGATYYEVTNLTTGRKTTFRSAQKFRSVAEDPRYSTQAEKNLARKATEVGLTKRPAMKAEGDKVGPTHRGEELLGREVPCD